MKVEKKSELIGRGGFYRRPVPATHWKTEEREKLAVWEEPNHSVLWVAGLP